MQQSVKEALERSKWIENISAAAHAKLAPADDGPHSEWAIDYGDAKVMLQQKPCGELLGRVVGFGLKSAVAKEAFGRVLNLLRSAGATSIRFRVAPSPQVDQIAGWLKEAGFKRQTFVVQWMASTLPDRLVTSRYEFRRIGASDSTIGNDRSSRNLQRQGFVKAYEEIVYERTLDALH